MGRLEISERASEIADTEKNDQAAFTEETIRDAIQEAEDLEEVMLYLGIHGRQLLVDRNDEYKIKQDTEKMVWTGWQINEAVRNQTVDTPKDLSTLLFEEGEQQDA